MRVKCAGLADEGPRDHASDFVRPAQNLARGLAHLVQLEQRNHFFMRGDLKDAVGRGVDDRRAGPHVLLAELLDDFGAGGGEIAERAAADAALEFVHDLAREAVREKRERLVEMDAGHLPMTRRRVFAGGCERAASISGSRVVAAAASPRAA